MGKGDDEMHVDPRDFTDEALRKVAPACADCGCSGQVRIAAGPEIYPDRSDLWRHREGFERWWWKCDGCGGYVGTHKGTITPLGSPAGPETRVARQEAHAAFDPLWQRKASKSGMSISKARGKGYAWLAEQLGIDRRDCHIGHMNAEMARRVTVICRGVRK